jgi:hypothetical protein
VNENGPPWSRTWAPWGADGPAYDVPATDAERPWRAPAWSDDAATVARRRDQQALERELSQATTIPRPCCDRPGWRDHPGGYTPREHEAGRCAFCGGSTGGNHEKAVEGY